MRSSFRGAFRADVDRYSDPVRRSFLSLCKLLFESYGLQASFVYRFGRALRALNGSPAALLVLPFWPVYWLGSVFIRKCYGITLALTADIGGGLYIGHFGGIKLERCALGAQCSIAQQTTISGPVNGDGVLRVGSRVWIGAHTRIVGTIEVGDGATIGAGSRVMSDVAARSLVMGNPARCVNAAYDNTAFLFPRTSGGSQFPPQTP